MKVTRAVPAAIAMKQAKKGDWRTTALMIGGIAVSFAGGIGLGAAYMLDRTRNGMIAQQQKDVLADLYRDVVAQRLGMAPEKVTARDLEAAAKIDPTLRNAIQRVNHDKDSQNRVSALAMGGGLALGGILPGVSGVSSAAAKGALAMAGNVGGSVAGSAASGLFDKPVLHTNDVVLHLNEKRTAGQPVTSHDIMMLRIAQDEALQARIKKQSGHAFHKMNAAQQTVIMQGMPELAASAEQDAQRFNSGALDEAALVTGAAGQQAVQGGWAERVGGPRNRGSFVDGVKAQRAQAKTQATQGI